MTTRQLKRTLRRDVTAARNALTPADVAARSAALLAHLQTLAVYRQATAVHCFVPFGTEVDTRPIIEELWGRGAQVAVPRVSGPRQMDHALITSWDDLQLGYRDIPEPGAGCPLTDPDGIDLVLVPGLAFDRKGGRLGYGGGFYDGFLAACPASRVALAFALQLVDEVPREAHDLPVHRIVTDAGIIEIPR